MRNQRKARKRGRPKGSIQKRKFLDTHVGRFIYLHEPLLYYIICPFTRVDFEPEVRIIETVVAASENPSFQTNRFKEYLNEYRENGLHVKRKKDINKDIVDHYSQLRFRRALNHVRINKDQIADHKSKARQSVQGFIDQIEK